VAEAFFPYTSRIDLIDHPALTIVLTYSSKVNEWVYHGDAFVALRGERHIFLPFVVKGRLQKDAIERMCDLQEEYAAGPCSVRFRSTFARNSRSWQIGPRRTTTTNVPIRHAPGSPRFEISAHQPHTRRSSSACWEAKPSRLKALYSVQTTVTYRDRPWVVDDDGLWTAGCLPQGLADWHPDFRRDLGLCLARLAVAHAGIHQPDEALTVAQHSLFIAAETRSHRTARQLHRASELLVTAGSPDHAQHLRHTLRTTLR
jgi:hypothetical protein